MTCYVTLWCDENVLQYSEDCKLHLTGGNMEWREIICFNVINVFRGQYHIFFSLWIMFRYYHTLSWKYFCSVHTSIQLTHVSVDELIISIKECVSSQSCNKCFVSVVLLDTCCRWSWRSLHSDEDTFTNSSHFIQLLYKSYVIT